LGRSFVSIKPPTCDAMTEKEAKSIGEEYATPAIEQRGEIRVATTAAVFVELSAGDPATGESASIVMCRLLDVSAAGMRIRIDRSVPLGSILALCARFNGPNSSPHSLRVVGEVRWVEQQENYYVIGLFLYESFDTDIAAWKLLIADQI